MRNAFWAPVVVLLLTAGNCGKQAVHESTGFIKTDQHQLDFGSSCPKPSDPRYEVPFPTQTIHLRNDGTALSNLNVFSVDDATKDVFLFDSTKVPATIATGGTADIVLTFQPKAGGPVQGMLTIQGDRSDGQDTYKITLLGAGKEFDPKPELTTNCQSPNTLTPTIDGCNPSDTSVPRKIRFADTAAGGTVDVVVTLKNKGCPTLTIQDVKVVTTSSDDGKDGFLLPADQATILTVLGGGNTEAATVTVRFAPTTANAIYKGTLTFTTNDPDNPSIAVALDGMGSSAQLYLDKTQCDFQPAVGFCDGKITIKNAGQRELTVTKVSLQSDNPLFQIETPEAFAGVKVPGIGQYATPIVVDYVPGATEGNDKLVVESDAGTATVDLHGGSAPSLTATPQAIMDFGVDLDHTPHYLTLELDNTLKYHQQLDLTVKDLALTGGRSAFAVLTQDPLPNDCSGAGAVAFVKGTTVKAGQSLVACVSFVSDAAGGNFTGNLTVTSDDPVYPDPTGLLLTLKAEATCDSKPSAIIEVRNQTDGTCPCSEGCPATAQCTTKLPAAGNGSVVVSGDSSFTPTFEVDQATGMCVQKSKGPVDSYEWALQVGNGTINPDGKTAQGSTTFSFDQKAALTGNIIKLKAYNTSGMGQASLTIYVTTQ